VKTLRAALPALAAVAGLAVLMEVLGRLDVSLFLPRFSSVVAVWWDMVRTGPLLRTLATSVRALLLGYAAAAAGGIVVGLLLGRYRGLARTFEPYVNAMMSAPLVALVPVLITLFGISEVVVVVTVFLFAFFVVLVNTRTGLESTDPSLVAMARSFGAGELQTFRKIYLPAALPAIMVGLELGAVTAVKGLVIGEMLVALTGMGELLAKYANMFLVTRLYAVILTILVLALLASYSVQALHRVLVRWK
jgi:NitT/TauT family transport system permease protein